MVKSLLGIWPFLEAGVVLHQRLPTPNKCNKRFKKWHPASSTPLPWNKDTQHSPRCFESHRLLGARTLLVAPDSATSSKKLLGTKGIATRSKEVTKHPDATGLNHLLPEAPHVTGDPPAPLPQLPQHLFQTKVLRVQCSAVAPHSSITHTGPYSHDHARALQFSVIWNSSG